MKRSAVMLDRDCVTVAALSPLLHSESALSWCVIRVLTVSFRTVIRCFWHIALLRSSRWWSAYNTYLTIGFGSWLSSDSHIIINWLPPCSRSSVRFINSFLLHYSDGFPNRGHGLDGGFLQPNSKFDDYLLLQQVLHIDLRRLLGQEFFSILLRQTVCAYPYILILGYASGSGWTWRADWKEQKINYVLKIFK